MYATIIRCDLRAIASTAARGRTGRSLAVALGALPGFVAFVALDADAEAAGFVVALCIVEDRASLAAAQRLTAQWHTDTSGAAESGLEELGAGAVIAQRGL
jgi:hypothetical protein